MTCRTSSLERGGTLGRAGRPGSARGPGCGRSGVVHRPGRASQAAVDAGVVFEEPLEPDEPRDVLPEPLEPLVEPPVVAELEEPSFDAVAFSFGFSAPFPFEPVSVEEPPRLSLR